MLNALFGPLLLAASTALAAQTPARMHGVEECASATAPIASPCALPTKFSSEAATRLIGSRDSIRWVVGDRLTFITRAGKDGRSTLCCSIQTPIEPIAGTSLAGITLRVPRIEEAILDVMDLNAPVLKPPEVVRGSAAPAAPPIANPLIGKVKPFAFDSRALGETRSGAVYLPPAVPEGAKLPVMYLADGAVQHFAPIMEAAVREGRAAPTIIVGINSAEGVAENCGKPRCDRRNLDYLSKQEPGQTQPDAQFSRHLRFVTDELMPWVESNYPASSRRQDRIAAGFSSGAAWAFAAAALRPDLFGHVLGMSPGSAATIDHASALGSARVYTGAGIFEPTFLAATGERARLARAAGAEVRLREMVAGHSMSMWDILFADGISWLLPPRR